MSVLNDKIDEVLQSLEVLGIIGLGREFIKSVIVGSVKLGVQCHVPVEQVSARMKEPRRLDEAYHRRLIRRANNLGLTDEVEALVLDAVYDCGVHSSVEEIIALRQEINE